MGVVAGLRELSLWSREEPGGQGSLQLGSLTWDREGNRGPGLGKVAGVARRHLGRGHWPVSQCQVLGPQDLGIQWNLQERSEGTGCF